LNHYLYVAAGSSISIVSSPCHVVATIFGVGTDFDGVGYDPHTKSVLVCEYNSGQLFVVSGTSVVGSFGGSFCSPGPMAWDSAADAMLVVDCCGEIDEVFGTFPSATTSFGECAPVAIAVAASYVWVSDDCGAPYSVDVFNASTFLGVGAFSLPTAPSGLGWDPVNHTVLVGSLFTHLMYVLYPATVATHGFQNTTFPLGTLLGTGGVTYSPSSHFMYVTGRIGNYLWTVSASGIVRHVELGSGADGTLMVYDPSNHYVYICGSGTGRLYVVS
jgi:DNA-binding beta-propeller fold protein YncE